MERGQWGQAESLLDQALESCPIDADARRHYAEVLIRRGATDEGVKHLEEARRLAPHDVSLTIRLGEIYLARRQLDHAENRAATAIAMDRDSADAWALRGRVRLARGQPREAMGDLQRALGYHPDDARLLQEVAQLYLDMERPARALLHLQTLSNNYVVGEEPVDLLALQAHTYELLGRHRDAAGCYRLATMRSQPSADLLYRLAQAEARAGQTDSALSAVQQVLQLDPTHKSGRQLLVQLSRATATTVTYTAATDPQNPN
jgi:tetratricopeptide (TPR) repeat protein